MRKQQSVHDRFSKYLFNRVNKNQGNPFVPSLQKKETNHSTSQFLDVQSPRHHALTRNNQQSPSSSYPTSIDSSNLCFTSSLSKHSSLSRKTIYSNQQHSHKTKTIQKKRKLRKLCDLEEHTCPICLQFIRDNAQMSCGHNFCYQCLKEWLNTSSTCPYCRNDCPFYTYQGKNNLIEQKAFRYEAQFPQEFVDEDDGLDYQCYMCQRTRQGDTVIICDQCLIHACHPQCDPRIVGPLGDDEQWFCHFCS